MQIGRETLELAYRFRISIRTHRHIMESVTYVNPSGLRVKSRPAPGHWTGTVVPILSSLCEYPTAFLLSFLLSFVGKWDPVRPGDDKVEESLHRGQ